MLNMDWMLHQIRQVLSVYLLNMVWHGIGDIVFRYEKLKDIVITQL